MRGISPLCREGILKAEEIIPCMYNDISPNDSEQLDLPLSPFSKFYTKFSHLHSSDNPQTIIRTQRERLKTFYSKHAQPLKEVWSRKRITKVEGFGRKILVKFELNCPLFRLHIRRNKSTHRTITDADFTSMNPNDILTLAAYFKGNH